MNRPTLSTYHVQNAIRRAKEMHLSGEYTIVPAEAEDGRSIWHVQHREDFDRSYFVETTPGHHNCTCPQFAKAGVCKHEYFALDTEETTTHADAAANRAAMIAASKLGAGQFDRMPSAAELMQIAHNADREMLAFASPFNDRVF